MTGETVSGPDMERDRVARADPKRNCPTWDMLWQPLPVESGTDDVAVWEHNWSAQQVAIRRDGDGGFVVEARDVDLLHELDSFDARDVAEAFATGLMEGELRGEVIR